MEQNLALCLLFSVLGGLLATLGKVIILLFEPKQGKGIGAEKKDKDSNPRGVSRVCFVLNLTVQGLCSLCLTYAPIYGPVSIFRPTVLAALLVSNLIILGGIMKKGDLKKSTQVATFYCAFAVVILPLVGPGVQEGQDIEELLMKPHALAWSVLLTSVFFLSTIYMLVNDLKRGGSFVAQTCLLAVGVTASVLSGTVAKAMSTTSGSAKIALLLYYIMLQLSWVVENIYQALFVTSFTFFVPLYSVLSLSLNAVTGMVVWEDWRVVASWPGYVSIFSMLVLSIYLLSDLEFGNSSNSTRNDVFLDKSQELLQVQSEGPPRPYSIGSRRHMVVNDGSSLEDWLEKRASENLEHGLGKVSSHTAKTFASAEDSVELVGLLA